MKMLILLIGAMCSPQLALAWGDLGHEVVAEIAEQIVAKDDKLKKSIQSIIGVEPFSISAIFPDHVRSDERFNDFAPYHYVTIYKNPKVHTEKNAMTILQKYPSVLTSKSFAREAKMLAFRYLVHIVGDMHQPLHAGNEYDRGGNNCLILWKPHANKEAQLVNLHAAWDTNLVDFIAEKYKKLEPEVKYYGYKNLAKTLAEKHNDILTRNQEVDVQAWVAETSRLRETSTYPDTMAEDARPYCKSERKDISKADMPLLQGAYIERSSAIAERQLVLAGARLAALLKETFRYSKTDKPVESEILKILQLTNDHHED